MKYSRRDEKLDALLGKEVIVVFKDNSVKQGILEFFKSRPDCYTDYNCRYKIGNCYFRKSQVKQIRLAES